MGGDRSDTDRVVHPSVEGDGPGVDAVLRGRYVHRRRDTVDADRSQVDYVVAQRHQVRHGRVLHQRRKRGRQSLQWESGGKERTAADRCVARSIEGNGASLQEIPHPLDLCCLLAPLPYVRGGHLGGGYAGAVAPSDVTRPPPGGDPVPVQKDAVCLVPVPEKELGVKPLQPNHVVAEPGRGPDRTGIGRIAVRAEIDESRAIIGTRVDAGPDGVVVEIERPAGVGALGVVACPVQPPPGRGGPGVVQDVAVDKPVLVRLVVGDHVCGGRVGQFGRVNPDPGEDKRRGVLNLHKVDHTERRLEVVVTHELLHRPCLQLPPQHPRQGIVVVVALHHQAERLQVALMLQVVV